MMKKIFIALNIILLSAVTFLPAAQETVKTEDFPLTPFSFSPVKQNSFFNLWADPSNLAYNDNGLSFHYQSDTTLYASLSKLFAVLNGDYDIICFWVDQLSVDGYGGCLYTDIGIEDKYWAVGSNTCLDIFARGPRFSEINTGVMALTSTLYAGGAIPFRLWDTKVSTGMSLIPIYRLKIPMGPRFFSDLLEKIRVWQVDRLGTLLDGFDLLQGLGLGINASILVQYKSFNYSFILNNIFDTRIYYKSFDLGIVSDNPVLLLTPDEIPVDPVEIIPFDFSFKVSYIFTLDINFISGIKTGLGMDNILGHLKNGFSDVYKSLALSAEVDFFNYFSFLTALNRGALYFDLIYSISSFEIDLGYFLALDNNNYAGPGKGLTLGINFSI